MNANDASVAPAPHARLHDDAISTRYDTDADYAINADADDRAAGRCFARTVMAPISRACR